MMNPANQILKIRFAAIEGEAVVLAALNLLFQDLQLSATLNS